MRKLLACMAALVLCLAWTVPALGSDYEVRPYNPRPGLYTMSGLSGDYTSVIVDYANRSGIRFTLVWDGIYDMRGVTGWFDNYTFHFSYATGGGRIEGTVMIDGVVFSIDLTSVTVGELGTVLAQEGYWHSDFHYADFDRYASGYFDRYGYYTREGFWLYNSGTSFTRSGVSTGSSGNSSSGGRSSGWPAPATAAPQQAFYALATTKLATRTGPGTQYAEPGTFRVSGQWIRILAKAYDRGGVLWVKCVIPTNNGDIVAWTGWKRFDHSTLDISLVPEEHW